MRKTKYLYYRKKAKKYLIMTIKARQENNYYQEQYYDILKSKFDFLASNYP
ncbi:MAG: hypothetical protein ACOC2W_03910 [bacterium]